MPRKKNPNNNYFNSDVEEAIHAYNKSTDERERNKLFSIVYPALCKVAEVWRNKIKPTYIELPPDELEMDCVTFMLEKLPMIKSGKGKAFSYLTVTARNYYIQGNMSAYKKRLKGNSIDSLPEHFDIEDKPSNRVEQMEWVGTLFETFMEYMNDNFDEMFPAKQQKIFGKVLIEKLRTDGISHDFNRRKFMNDVSDETGIARGLVTKQVNRVASFFSTFKEYFEVYGVKPKFKQKLHLNDEDKEYIRKNYQHYSKTNGLSGISRKLGINYEVLRNYVRDAI